MIQEAKPRRGNSSQLLIRNTQELLLNQNRSKFAGNQNIAEPLVKRNDISVKIQAKASDILKHPFKIHDLHKNGRIVLKSHSFLVVRNEQILNDPACCDDSDDNSKILQANGYCWESNESIDVPKNTFGLGE